MALFQNSLGFLPPYFGSGLNQRNFGFVKSAVVVPPATKYIIASGGTMVQSGDWKIHTFLSTDNFNVTQLATNPTYNLLKVNVVAGGGGGGNGGGGGGGGAGAGGFIENLSYSLSNGTSTYSCVVGSGGTGSVYYNSPATTGGNSSFDGLLSYGGGSGGIYTAQGTVGGNTGGECAITSLGVATAIQGNNGGFAFNTNAYGGGGGGGSNQIGQNGSSTNGGNGGNGSLSSITGNYYSGGGGGAISIGGIGGIGGLGGGGNGEVRGGVIATNGTVNTGGGGGGSSVTNGGNGGSGIIVISYYSPVANTPYLVATGGTLIQSGDWKIHTFNSTDNFSVLSLSSNPAYNSLEYLVVAGGGGGGGSNFDRWCGGGGGAGGFLNSSVLAVIGSYPVAIGAGGLRGNKDGTDSGTDSTKGLNGSNSSFYGITSIGGGGGGKARFTGGLAVDTQGSNGGSGGGNGANYNGILYAGGLGTAGQGFDGGQASVDGNGTSGGGGGAASVGTSNIGTTNSGGGLGISSSISGTSNSYSNGGNVRATTTSNRLPNTGDGGASALGDGVTESENGGSGIIVISYYSPVASFTSWYNQVLSNGGSLTTLEQNDVSLFFYNLGADYTKFDRLWVHGLSNAIAAKTSLANPTSTMVTAVNSPIFLEGIGFKGDAASSYLDTNFNIGTQGVNYTLNSASLFFYERNSLIVDAQCDIGVLNSYQFPRISSDSYFTINNGGTNLNFPVVDSQGFYYQERISSSQTDAYKDGIYQASCYNTGVQVDSTNLMVLALNGIPNTGGADYFSSGLVALSGAGGSGINQLNFYNAIQQLGTSLGWFSYTSNFIAVVFSRGGFITSAEGAYLRTFEASMGTDLAEFDRLYIQGLSDEIAALTSFVNPNSTMATNVNSATFIPNQGFQGNGSSAYINYHYNFFTDGVKYTTPSASYGVYSLTNNTETAYELGSYTTWENTILLYYAGNAYGNINADNTYGNAISFVNTDTKGFYQVGVTGGTAKVFKNDSEVFSAAHWTSAPLTNEENYGLAVNTGSPAFFSSKTHALVFFGSGDYAKLNFYNSVQTLSTNLGWSV